MMKKRSTVIIAAIVAAIVLVAVITSLVRAPAAAGSPPPNTDPRQGAVTVADHVYKICDGTTLLYVNNDGDAGGLAAVANSPECA